MTAYFDRHLARAQLRVSGGSAGRELREELFRQKVRFTLAMWRIQIQTLGFQLGISQVDASILFGSLHGLTASVRSQSMAAA